MSDLFITEFVDVILPLSVANTYTYRLRKEHEGQVVPGMRVVVQFGRKKLYSALVRKVHSTPPQHYQAKYVESLLDDAPVVVEQQFKHWEWIADYYMSTIGEVMSAALPGGLKLSSESRVVLSGQTVEESALTDDEFLLFEALENNEILTLQEVSDITGKKNTHSLIQSMIAKGVVLLEEELKSKYKPKMVEYVELEDAYRTEEAMQQAFEQTSRAPKQQHMLMTYIQWSGFPSDPLKPVKKTLLQKAVKGDAALTKNLVKKGIFSILEVEEDRMGIASEADQEIVLSPEQTDCRGQIEAHWKKQRVCLLHGVTGSGKTAIYIKLIEEVIASGQQVLYLLPEIALTTQIINRLRRHFGDRIGIFHSKFNQNERVETWKNLVSDKRYDIVLGARSALFLPFSDLGLIVVDEEHESSFKQYDPAPRYHARDAAVVLGQIHDAKVLLGSATPSVESMYNAQTGKYGYVELNSRFSGVQMPEILVSDLKEARKKREMNGAFSAMLIKSMEAAFEKNEQVILFQNRRGFSPFVQCETCGWTPDCNNCDVTLTYHKFLNRLKCHYCGNEKEMPNVCPACGSNTVKLNGLGTEKIEEDLQLIFPDKTIKRMDLDTTRSKNAYQNLLNEFEDRQIDVLVGTQMVTKGLDFDHVSLVGIISADQMLNFQDFRAHERSYQLMSQVSGRAGRQKKRGRVIIQSFTPYHPIIRQVIDHDFEGMYKQQVLERRNFHYPPFVRLLKLTLQHKDRQAVFHAAHYLAKELKERFGERVLGPEYPAVARIRNRYHMQIMLKFERTSNIQKIKDRLRQLFIQYGKHEQHKKVRLIIDVDPI